MKIKKFINDTYGSGSELKLVHVIVIMLCTTLINLLMFFHIDLNAVRSGLPLLINKLFFYYMELIIFCSGLLFLSLYLYCKPIPKIDKFKIAKIIFVFFTLLLFGILFFPYAVATAISNKSGKILKIKGLTANIIYALITILVWILLLVFLLGFFYGLGDALRILLKINSPQIYSAVGTKAVTYYGMFISMLLSNKIAKTFFFKISKIKDPEITKQVNHEMKLIWYYMIWESKRYVSAGKAAVPMP